MMGVSGAGKSMTAGILAGRRYSLRGGVGPVGCVVGESPSEIWPVRHGNDSQSWLAAPLHGGLRETYPLTALKMA